LTKLKRTNFHLLLLAGTRALVADTLLLVLVYPMLLLQVATADTLNLETMAGQVKEATLDFRSKMVTVPHLNNSMLIMEPILNTAQTQEHQLASPQSPPQQSLQPNTPVQCQFLSRHSRTIRQQEA